jgi:ATP-dependent DNA helicase DinG
MTDLSRRVASIFSPTGALSKLPEFEFRPQQQTMATSIADALQQQHHLIVEAPTGVGKSLAYLIPSILFALEENRKAIVSTHTKNLQEQLFQKDLPIVRSVLGTEFTATVLKGRGNYLCTSRMRNAIASTASMFDSEGTTQLQRIHTWSRTTHDGDVENLPFVPKSEVWAMVCSEKGVCSSAACGPDCFFQRAKERARSANLVIMNHALLFALMVLQGTDEGYVFNNDFLVLDEAHMLESVAGSGIGKRLSRYQVLAALRRLYNPKTKTGLLAKRSTRLKKLCAGAVEATSEFFGSIQSAARASASIGSAVAPLFQREIRVRVPYIVSDTLTAPLADIQSELHKLEEESPGNRLESEFAAVRRSLWESQILVREFLEQPEQDFAYWVELAGVRSENVTLSASPIDIAQRIGPQLFRDGTSLIMTSATLSVGGSLNYFQQRVGAQGIAGIILDSPFDHSRQMKLRIARNIPEPDSEEYASVLPSWLLQSIEQSEGKALVLFTNTTLMNAVAHVLRDELSRQGITLLVQGADQQRHRLLEEFKRDVHSVLFGLESFWMGVDVPGEALEHVIITRLPFAVPNHPLTEARMEKIVRRGGNSFTEYTLPEAVLKLRQGVGRLLRSRQDKGIVTILDSRILSKQYGRVFISSLPHCPVELFTKSGEAEYGQPEDW